MDLGAALLKVIEDEPGERLVLEGEKLTLPSVAAGLLGGAALGAVESLLELSGRADDRKLWRPRRVSADRSQGKLKVDEVHVVRDEERSETIELARVEALVLRTRYRTPASSRRQRALASDQHRSLEASVHLRDGDRASQRTFLLDVLGVDGCAKAADLAFRLGAALGLSRQRVVRSDPRQIEIEMRGESATGLEELPTPELRADYAHGRVAAAAARAAAQYRMPAPDPAGFPSDELRVTRWTPGDDVRLDRPMQGAALGCLPFALAGFGAGPLVWFLFHDATGATLAAVLGVLFGGAALAMAIMSLPRHVRLSWERQELSVSGLLRRRRIPFAGLAALELRCVRRVRKSGSRDQFSHTDFSCALQARLRGDGQPDPAPVELITTREFKNDPEAPYAAALPLARELAEALGVEWRVIDYQ